MSSSSATFRKFVLISLDKYNILTSTAENQKAQFSDSATESKLLSIKSRYRPAAPANRDSFSSKRYQQQQQSLPSAVQRDQVEDILETLFSGLSGSGVEKSRAILKLIDKSDRIGIEISTSFITIDGSQRDIRIDDFLYDLQATKKNLTPEALSILDTLSPPVYLCTNSIAKEFLINEKQDPRNKQRAAAREQRLSDEPSSKKRRCDWITTE